MLGCDGSLRISEAGGGRGLAAELENTGVGVTGDAPWGTHGCLFYETKQDLLDTLIPYLKNGLEQRELCLWIVSEPLTPAEAIGALRQAVPGLDRHLGDQDIEVIPDADWYLQGTSSDLRRIPGRFHDKLEAALANGYAGLRATCDTGRLNKEQGKSFCAYESELNELTAKHRLMALCTYPMDRSSLPVFLSATCMHRVCATLRRGYWEIIETPELREARAEIKKLNQCLERKVVERTRVLRAANEELRKETQHRRVEEELWNQKEVLQKIFDHIPVMIKFMDAEGRIKLVNRAWEQTLGWTLDEIRTGNVDILVECYPDPNDLKRVLRHISRATTEWNEFKTAVRDGRVIDTCWANVQLSDGSSIGIGQDITDRKEWEARVRATADQLRALSASTQAGREEERTRVARTIHDELGSAFTALKWELEVVDKALSKPLDAEATAALQAKIAAMMKLADSTINTVRRIAWELRPSILDDLGLVEAIEWQTRQFEARTGIVCQRQEFLDDVHFNEEQSTAIFRIFQEAMTNILRHASATRVDITMTQELGEFVLTVSDNGAGIKPVEKSGLGILGMQERVHLLGGEIQIHGLEGAGTTVVLRIPLPSRISGASPSHSQ